MDPKGLQELRRRKGKLVRLDPPARQFKDGLFTDYYEGFWKVTELTETEVHLEPATQGMGFRLPLENIEEFRKPDWLLLRCFVIIRSNDERIWIDITPP